MNVYYKKSTASQPDKQAPALLSYFWLCVVAMFNY